MIDKGTLRQLCKRSDARGATACALHMVLTLVSGSLVWVSTGWWWMPIALFGHGLVVIHWFAPLHECAHDTAFKSRWLNRVVGHLSGAIVGLSFINFRYEHFQHHRATNIPDDDPEYISHSASRAGMIWFATGIPYFSSLLGVLARHPLGKFTVSEQRYLPQSMRKRARIEAIMLCLLYAIIILVSIAANDASALWLWLVPRVIAEPYMRLVRMTEHGGCDHLIDVTRNTRSVVAWLPMRWLAWNMSWHAEHHALPAVPFHRLGVLHRLIGSRLRVSPSYHAAYREMIGDENL